MYVVYHSNNSGGRWWLSDEDWKNLEKAGWKIHWAGMTEKRILKPRAKYEEIVRLKSGCPKLVKAPEGHWSRQMIGGDGRYLGALAKIAYRPNLHLEEAVKEWESITGHCATDAGCPCCGNPHYFEECDEKGEMIKDGPHICHDIEYCW